MSDSAVIAVDREGLRELVRSVDPAAFVVPSRIIRRVVRTLSPTGRIGFRASHVDSLAIRAEEALAVVDRDELGLSAVDPVAETILLLAEPELDDLESADGGTIRLYLWRSLFHAAIHKAFRGLNLADDEIRDRIQTLGALEFEEVRGVLWSDARLIGDDRDDRAVFEEFVATFLELLRFEPRLLRATFPALTAIDAVALQVYEIIDIESFFESTRIPGALDPDSWNLGRDDDRPPDVEAIAAKVATERREPLFHRLLKRAERAEARGNLVAGAIARVQGAAFAAPGHAGRARSGARDDLARLALRLNDAIKLEPSELLDLREVLPSLLPGAARGYWSVEARFLYDLQKVRDDHERPIHALDFFGWAFSLGRRPLKNPLPLLSKQLKTRHLRLAARRLRSIRLEAADRERLAKLINAAILRSEHDFQSECRPLISTALESVGFQPRNAPERAASRKLVEELTDTIAEQGLLSLGLLRDAIARGRLKIPDLSGPIEFLKGNRLLKADRALAKVLEGVYRPGEFYLRWLQNLSAVGFGTKFGRFLTLNVFLPFGSAFIAIEAIQHIVHMFTGPHGPIFNHPANIVVVGLFALALIRSANFRARVVSSLRFVGAAFKSVLIDAPRWLANRPWVRAIFDSPIAREVWRWAIEPALLSAPLWMLQPGRSSATWIARAATFVAVDLALNSRAGRRSQEIILDSFARGWRWIGADLVPGAFRLVFGFFQRVLEAIDRVLYSVDQWLRFRAGESRATVVAKIAFGFVWFFIAYIARFAVNLLIEPQLNPIKHFPVVTVSHKILLSQSQSIYRLLLPFGEETAKATIGPLLLLTPGIFGFFVWEFRANWKLYEANRKRDLPQVSIGHHGETLAGLLRPGLHSGTLPKLFAKLRRAEAAGPSRRPAARRLEANFEHLETALKRYVERDALWLLEESGVEALEGLTTGKIEAATNFIRATIFHPDAPVEPLRITFEERSGRLIARAFAATWIDRLADAERAALANALAGLYLGAAVDTLIVEPDFEAESLPSDGRPRILWNTQAIAWDRWVDTWENSKGATPIALWVDRVLPKPARAATNLDRETTECP